MTYEVQFSLGAAAELVRIAGAIGSAASVLQAAERIRQVFRESTMPVDLQSVAEAARPIFKKLELALLATHRHAFVSVEPLSEECFIGETLSDAIEKAWQKYPERLVRTFRVGHAATVHFGMQSR